MTKDAKVTDAQITKYYNENKSQYNVAESRDVRHILVKTKAEADKIYDQIKAGGDFAALAKKYSLDPGSAAIGGKLTITRGQTVAPFDKTAFLLATNEVSRPVKTQFGYHIIQAGLRRQAGHDDAAEGCQGADHGHAQGQGEERRDHELDGRNQEDLRVEDVLRRGIRPAGCGDRHFSDDDRLTVGL